MGKINKEDIVDVAKDKEAADRMQEVVDKEVPIVKENVDSVLAKLDSVSQLADAEKYNLSYRQQFLERVTQYRKIQSRYNADYQNAKRDLFYFYRTGNQNYKHLNYYELRDAVEADLRHKTRVLEIVNGQIKFLEESIDSLDKAGFAIKNKYQFQLNHF